jgi:hypothetical protein
VSAVTEVLTEVLDLLTDFDRQHHDEFGTGPYTEDPRITRLRERVRETVPGGPPSGTGGGRRLTALASAPAPTKEDE